MRTPFRSIPGIAALAIGLTAVACGGDDADEEIAPADTTAFEEETTGEAGLEPSTASVSMLTVSNPMPHAMVVRVAYEGGGEAELGTVPANGEVVFTVSATPGETVVFSATDEGGTHTVDETVELSPDNHWTVE
ncbi:MAG TPA: hypothetical protein VM778_03585 [Gemmatimonadota bacterium]|nr:hypothetical protein [Gemmatimonadota bacterium]